MSTEHPLVNQQTDALTSGNDGLSVQQLSSAIEWHLRQTMGVNAGEASATDLWEALNLSLRDILVQRVSATRKRERKEKSRRVYYLSLEFLIGRLLNCNLQNLGLVDTVKAALEGLGHNPGQILYNEDTPNPALGNGGLGRLAACFLDSMTTLNIPAFGYGINYRYGLFRQGLAGGHQTESPDTWRENGNAWGIERPKRKREIQLYGRIEKKGGKTHWVDTKRIVSFPTDILISGYNTERVNTLRLWDSRAESGFCINSFSRGDYQESRAQEVKAENISQILYPDDSHREGKELRLLQQYLLVACSLGDIITRFKRENSNMHNLHEKVCIQLNDTHPALAIPELLRILIDEENMTFDQALGICRQTFNYTNHTLLPEALEVWPQSLLAYILPRHLQLIHKLNFHMLHKEAESAWPGQRGIWRHLSLIQEPHHHNEEQMVRMANLSVAGSRRVNGVAALHSQLLKTHLFPEFNQLWPDKLINITNGISPRRWLMLCNPCLATLLDDLLTPVWRKDLEHLQELRKYADDTGVHQQLSEIKRDNKQRLADIIRNTSHITVSPDAIFDVQIKRIHEYKRQQMNLLHIAVLYRQLLDHPETDIPSRVFIFSGKAAPAYTVAKVVIHAINRLAERINNDRRLNNRLKVVFLPNYNVGLAEKIIPAADVSEQISTAGFEASGTGNMKLSLNGALTVGTLDGANIEIEEAVGKENFFRFGLTVKEVEELRCFGYDPLRYIHDNDELKAVIDWFSSGDLSAEDPEAFLPLLSSLLENGDYFMTLADFLSYENIQQKIAKTWEQQNRWMTMVVHNIAGMGRFSSDRSIRDYATHIWNVPMTGTKQ